MKHPHLKNAPIAEAVIDFRFQPALIIEPDKISAIHKSIILDYPTIQENKEMQLGFVVGPDQTTQQTVSDSIIGYRFENSDKKFVFVASKNGFTLSKLPPYDNWDSFVLEAKKLANIFFGILGHQTIVRTAVRYINQIQIDEIQFDFDDYLVAGPKVPEGLPDMLSEFLIRNVIPCVEKKALVTIIQQFNAVNSLDPVRITLDIDAVCFEEYESNSGKQWEFLNSLRELKNNAFFKSLHPKGLEKYI